MAARRGGDRGASEAELVILTPLLLVVVGLIVSLGRLGLAKVRVEDAAGAAVAAAVTGASPPAARRGAAGAVREDLAAEGVGCLTLSVSVDLDRFHPGGEVAVRLTCRVSLSQAAVPGLPGSMAVTGTARAPVDPNRNRPR
ncbi:MAG TPA: TadE/TadG family type IV pilus assembly protein [Acidimicrobiales bacterium]|jgi:Flp pilus assembly protein TadG|nr:TadE/TadG family type IV pilus assembly protein [Acidimicrobiales bacterium]